MYRKVTFIGLLSTILLTASVAGAVQGDLNCDDKKNVVDVQIAIFFALSVPLSPLVDADANQIFDTCDAKPSGYCGEGTVLAGDICVVAPGPGTVCWDQGYAVGYDEGFSMGFQMGSGLCESGTIQSAGDACNTCVCTAAQEWECTAETCGELVQCEEMPTQICISGNCVSLCGPTCAFELLQTIADTYGQVDRVLTQLKELATLSLCDTQTDKERAYLDHEFQILFDGIEVLTETTQYQGIPLLGGDGEGGPLVLSFYIADTNYVASINPLNSSTILSLPFYSLDIVTVANAIAAMKSLLEIGAPNFAAEQSQLELHLDGLSEWSECAPKPKIPTPGQCHGIQMFQGPSCEKGDPRVCLLSALHAASADQHAIIELLREMQALTEEAACGTKTDVQLLNLDAQAQAALEQISEIAAKSQLPDVAFLNGNGADEALSLWLSLGFEPNNTSDYEIMVTPLTAKSLFSDGWAAKKLGELKWPDLTTAANARHTLFEVGLLALRKTATKSQADIRAQISALTLLFDCAIEPPAPAAKTDGVPSLAEQSCLACQGEQAMLLDTASSALDAVGESFDAMKSVANYAANPSTTDSERITVNTVFQTHLQAIGSMIKNTQYNTLPLFNADDSTEFLFHQGVQNLYSLQYSLTLGDWSNEKLFSGAAPSLLDIVSALDVVVMLNDAVETLGYEQARVQAAHHMLTELWECPLLVPEEVPWTGELCAPAQPQTECYECQIETCDYAKKTTEVYNMLSVLIAEIGDLAMAATGDVTDSQRKTLDIHAQSLFTSYMRFAFVYGNPFSYKSLPLLEIEKLHYFFDYEFDWDEDSSALVLGFSFAGGENWQTWLGNPMDVLTADHAQTVFSWTLEASATLAAAYQEVGGHMSSISCADVL